MHLRRHGVFCLEQLADGIPFPADERVARGIGHVHGEVSPAEEDALLTPHLAHGMDAAEFAAIAARLNRTWRAVEGRFYVLKKAAGLTKAQRRKAKPVVKTFTPPANGRPAGCRRRVCKACTHSS